MESQMSEHSSKIPLYPWIHFNPFYIVTSKNNLQYHCPIYMHTARELSAWGFLTKNFYQFLISSTYVTFPIRATFLILISLQLSGKTYK
jgi:hypothetical protein